MTLFQTLAESYPQLYLAPGEQGAALYPDVVLKGKPVPAKDLSHFHTSPADSDQILETPAGAVRAITLGDRHDFECFLQIIVKRCVPTSIPPTQGASIVSGIINRGKITRHEEEFFHNAPESMSVDQLLAEWVPEQKRFLSDKKNYTDSLIVLSCGPYSNVSADAVGLTEEEWLEKSLTIRMYHECTHFVCRRLFPENKDAVRDELVADAVGVYAAFGKVDRALIELFMGIQNNAYVGGRLENYTDTPQALIPEISAVLSTLEQVAAQNSPMQPLDLAICFEEALVGTQS